MIVVFTPRPASNGNQQNSICSIYTLFSFKAGFEVVPIDESKKLDPTGLAVGAAMTHSKKRKREIIESAYNR